MSQIWENMSQIWDFFIFAHFIGLKNHYIVRYSEGVMP